MPPISADQAAAPADMTLHLEVSINGASTQLVEPFVLTPDKHLQIAQGDLEDIGLKPPAGGDAHSLVDLASLHNVTYRYDEPHQIIDFSVTDADRLPRQYDARGNIERSPPAQSGWGTVLNYRLFATSTNQIGQFPSFQGVNATLDARAFSPYGTLSQTAIVGSSVTSRTSNLRLDSTYEYASQDLMMTGRAGDFISGGLNWTRPIRLGGLQLQRDFSLRSDLVTQPLPSIGGSAAVPSTVDVFVNNVKTYSQQVSAGPYNISNLPIIASNGMASVVVTDASGYQTTTSVPMFNAPNMLKPGFIDFALDSGFARRNYGILSDDYDRHPVGMATGRYGVTDWLTAEAHTEGGAGLANGGLGAVTRLGRFGTLSLGAAASHYSAQTGGQVYAEYNLQFSHFTFDLASQRVFGRYNDLAAVTAPLELPGFNGLPFVTATDPRPPRELDRISVSTDLGFDPTTVGVSFINLVQADKTRSRIVTASLTRQLPKNVSFFATGYANLSKSHDMGLYAGLSFQLGDTVHANIGGSLTNGGNQTSVDIGNALGHEDDSWSWRLRDNEGANPVRIADAGYRSSYGTVSLEASQQGKSFNGQGTIEGSAGYVVNGGPFVSNTIQDGFAVVNTGVPGVPVYQDNRYVGKTNVLGQYVLPDLPSYQNNHVGIDPLALPMNADASTTRQAVSTARRSGVALTFGIDHKVDGAIVIFRDAAGVNLLAGSKGQLQGTDESFVVGYDGQAYVKHLKAENTVSIDLGDHDCTATFGYQPRSDRQPLIGPVTCQ
ncbi:fimbria/pilus outer membrane usher protein [Methylovirgula sp. 4M-Z18]|uniref:fimbria/pilus outer membrane usher protein n=1 Tax=Methylovirgula sp. 4M-Z18 TaxID=2293567 RepID=UPI001314DE5E|nr:fimbria/pilus outer membrane usher protein [Methylovirgula sp. 4M-Z18]